MGNTILSNGLGLTCDRKRFYTLVDPRLEGHFSIKGAQKAAQLAAHCLSRDPKVRPRMSEVVEALCPLPNLKDMATSSCSYNLNTMQGDCVRSSPRVRNALKNQRSFSRKGGQPGSLSMSNGTHASPHHRYLRPSIFLAHSFPLLEWK